MKLSLYAIVLFVLSLVISLLGAFGFYTHEKELIALEVHLTLLVCGWILFFIGLFTDNL